MQPAKSLDEISKYLLYVSDALRGVASSFGVDKNDRETMEKYAADIHEYFKGIESLKLNIVAKEQAQRKLQVNAELEYVYENCKRQTNHAQENLRIINARLKHAEKAGTKRDVEECKQRLTFYTREYVKAQQNEASAKRAIAQQGA